MKKFKTVQEYIFILKLTGKCGSMRVLRDVPFSDNDGRIWLLAGREYITTFNGAGSLTFRYDEKEGHYYSTLINVEHFNAHLDYVEFTI